MYKIPLPLWCCSYGLSARARKTGLPSTAKNHHIQPNEPIDFFLKKQLAICTRSYLVGIVGILVDTPGS